MAARIADQHPDPFREHAGDALHRQFDLLGARVEFSADSAVLMALAAAAYSGLPAHRLGNRQPRLHVALRLTADAGSPRSRSEPPPLRMLSGAGCVAAATAGSGFAVVSPERAAALVSVPQRMLKFPYHVRYELIEFAVFALAARVQGLISMHGACIGHRGRGVLLMGPSGSGKSTVTLYSALAGLQFLSEDSIFMTARTRLATAIPNYLHVRADALRSLDDAAAVARIRRSPVIRRRSGVRKYEVDLRRGGFRLAPRALQICAVVFLTTRVNGREARAVPLTYPEAYRRLCHEQAYAAGQPGWRTFGHSLRGVPAFELRRGQHPRDSVQTLLSLMS